MDGDGIQLIFMLIIAAGFGGYSILEWYRRKENQELKSVEFRIIAAEHNLEYQEDGSTYLSRLSHRDLLPGRSVKIKNVVSKQHGSKITRIFDASHVVGSGKSSKTEYLIGIAIEFEDVLLPRFDLDQAEFLDAFHFFDNMSKVKNDALPNWLKHKYSLYYKRQSLPYEVINLFRGKEELKAFIGQSDFHLLAGGSKTLVYYLKGETQSTLGFYKEMESRALRLARIFDYGSISTKNDGAVDNIKILKELNNPYQ